MSPSKRHFLFIILILIATIIFQSDAPPGDLFADNRGENIVGMGNPSAVYCQEMGYQYQIVSDEMGENGICRLPDGITCDAWSFLQGECGQDYSYCAQQGLETVVKYDGENGLTQTYAVCVDEEQVERGSVVEMVELDRKNLGCGVGLEETRLLPYTSGAEPTLPLDFDPPASFDWRNYLGGDWLTPIRNQDSCGSCWAFAAVGVAESVLNIAEGDPTYDLDLSEQYLVSDCYPDPTNWEGYQNCCGGWKDLALEYIRDEGIPDDDCMPYDEDGGCYPCTNNDYPTPPVCGGSCNDDSGGACSDSDCSERCGDWADKLVYIQNYGYLGYNALDNTIKQYLVDYGPLAVSVGIGSSVGGGFNGDIYECSSSDTNHAVVIVGYDDAGGYWIIRNSWGSWNGDGYYKLGYGECGVNKYVYYADHLAPEIDLQGNGLSISSGDLTPSLTDHTDFGSTAITGGTITRTFTIENSGSAELNLTGSPELIEITGTHASDFTVILDPTSPVAAGGGTTTFQVSFDPSDVGLREATFSIDNNDIDENPYTFAIQGTGLSPEMDVQGNSQSIPDGDITPSLTDHTDFGSINVSMGAVTRTFTIENSGSVELNLTGSPDLIEITGTHASDFTVTLDPTSPVAAGGGTTTFQVRFDPSDVGLREATISIDNNDIDENPYTFAVQGTGTITFSDVLPSHWAFDWIEAIAAVGVTSGYPDGTYRPLNPVTRAEMALFLLKAKYGSGYPVPPASGTRFEDVIPGDGILDWADDYIEELASQGITAGCSVDPPLYCPNAKVTRAQMALFLLKAKYGSGYPVPPASGTRFEDVIPGDGILDWADDYIEELASQGITAGCSVSPPLYCPDAIVTREQMAVFLVRTFNLPMP